MDKLSIGAYGRKYCPNYKFGSRLNWNRICGAKTQILIEIEFRADINSMIQKTKKTHRPIILTQNGKTTAVVIEINDYQRLIYEKQIIEGKVLTTKQMRSKLKERFPNA